MKKRFITALILSLSIIAFLMTTSPVKAAKVTKITVTNSAPMRTITGTRNNLTEELNFKYNQKATDLKTNVGKIKSASITVFFWAPFLNKPLMVTEWDFSPNNIYIGRAYITISHLNKNKWYTFTGPTWDLDDSALQKITAKPNKKGEIKYVASDYYFNYDSPIKTKKDVLFNQKRAVAPALMRLNKIYRIRAGKKVRTISDHGELTNRYLKGNRKYHFVAKMRIKHYGLCYQLRDKTGEQYWIAKKYLR